MCAHHAVPRKSGFLRSLEKPSVFRDVRAGGSAVQRNREEASSACSEYSVPSSLSRFALLVGFCIPSMTQFLLPPQAGRPQPGLWLGPPTLRIGPNFTRPIHHVRPEMGPTPPFRASTNGRRRSLRRAGEGHLRLGLRVIDAGLESGFMEAVRIWLPWPRFLRAP